MVSVCFERARFSLYGRDLIGCIPGGSLTSKGCREHAPQSSLDEETKKYTYSVSVALRASIALGSQQGAFSAKSIYPAASSVTKADEKSCINSRADIEVRGVSSGESSVALES